MPDTNKEEKPKTVSSAPVGSEPTEVVENSGTKQAESAKEAGEQLMTIPADMMQRLLDTMASLEQSNADLMKSDMENKKQLGILRDSVNRGRLEEAEGKHSVKGPPRAKLMVFDSKIVIGWKMAKPGTVGHQMLYHPLNLQVPSGEDLKINLLFLGGGETGPIQYVDFIRAKERVEVEKVGESDVNWVVRFRDQNISQEDLVIDPLYLNP